MEYTPITSEQSKSIILLKGFAIFLVIMIHSDVRNCMNVEPYSALDVYMCGITRVIAFDACPIFFFISGYLFFLKQESIISKWKKRMRSIVLPYFIWCLIGFLIPFVIQNVLGLSSLYQGSKMKLISDFEFLDYFKMFWNIRDGAPILMPLWFLRNLIVLVALTPIFALMVRFTKIIFPMLLFINYVFFHFGLLCVSSIDLFFFGMGCWFSLNYSGKMFSCLDGLNFPVIAVLWWGFFLTTMFFYVKAGCVEIFHNLFMIVDCLFMYKVVRFLSRKYELKFLIKLSQASFFIYLFHEPWMGYAVKLFFKFFRLEGFFAYIFPWALCLATITCSYIVYLGLKRFAPRLLSVAVGSR